MAEKSIILICDDDESLRYLARETLENEGFEVVEASDGATALELARTMKPDLILLDVRMPTMDGFEVCSRIRDDANLVFTPVLIVTGLEDTNSIEHAYHVGATSFTAKPVNWQTLPHDVRYMLRSSRIEADLRSHVAALENTKRELEDGAGRLTEALAAASAADQAKSQFLATMSHELRTPLNAIIGFSEVMQGGMFGPLSERYRDYSADIFNCGNHLLGLINDILDLSKLEAGQFVLHEEDVDLTALLLECVGVMELQAKKAKVCITLDRSVRGWRLNADPKRLKQILLNLLSNAVKFTGEGGDVRVSISSRGNMAAIMVADTGIGMSLDEIPRAFETFGQIDSNLSRRYEGSGLGLPVTKHLVELHGGTLTIESEPKVGSTVTVLLRALKTPDEASEAA